MCENGDITEPLLVCRSNCYEVVAKTLPKDHPCGRGNVAAHDA